MRKVIAITLTCVMVFFSVDLWAGDVAMAMEYENVTPRYQSVAYYIQQFNIAADGTANYSLTVQTKTEDVLDRVTATISIKNVSGVSVYRSTKILVDSYDIGRFTCYDSTVLNQSGTYEMEVTYKCYNGNTLIETIIADPKVVSY